MLILEFKITYLKKHNGKNRLQCHAIKVHILAIIPIGDTAYKYTTLILLIFKRLREVLQKYAFCILKGHLSQAEKIHFGVRKDTFCKTSG